MIEAAQTIIGIMEAVETAAPGTFGIPVPGPASEPGPETGPGPLPGMP